MERLFRQLFNFLFDFAILLYVNVVNHWYNLMHYNRKNIFQSFFDL